MENGMKVKLFGVCVLSLLAPLNVWASPGDETPAWLQQAAAIKLPTYDRDVPAVVLVDASTTTIDADGRVNEVYNFAVRVLRREGREYAVGQVGYIPDIGKVKDLSARLVRGKGQPKRYATDDEV